MYSTKEKLNHFRQLSSPSAAEADLALLCEKSSVNTNIIRYNLAPRKNAENILFDLLDVVTHEEIVRNRREFLAAKESEEQTDDIPDHNPNSKDENNGEPSPEEAPNSRSEEESISNEEIDEGQAVAPEEESISNEEIDEEQGVAPKEESISNEEIDEEQTEKEVLLASEKKSTSRKKKSIPK